MKSRNFVRLNGLCGIMVPTCAGCRTILEPLIFLAWPLGLFLTLVAR